LAVVVALEDRPHPALAILELAAPQLVSVLPVLVLAVAQWTA
jgi:hypothetical protein